MREDTKVAPNRALWTEQSGKGESALATPPRVGKKLEKKKACLGQGTKLNLQYTKRELYHSATEAN